MIQPHADNISILVMTILLCSIIHLAPVCPYYTTVRHMFDRPEERVKNRTLSKENFSHAVTVSYSFSLPHELFPYFVSISSILFRSAFFFFFCFGIIGLWPAPQRTTSPHCIFAIDINDNTALRIHYSSILFPCKGRGGTAKNER